MLYRFKIIYFFILQMFSSTVFSQEVLTIEDAVAAALKNNYDIQLLRNDSSVYALNNRFAKAAFLPRFNATSAVLFNNNNTKQNGRRTRPNDAHARMKHGQNGQASLNIAQPERGVWRLG